MQFCLITCRSLTQAQRSASVLERVGIKSRTFRCPKCISDEGCGYCVRIACKALDEGLAALEQAGLKAKKVFLAEEDGSYREVEQL